MNLPGNFGNNGNWLISVCYRCFVGTEGNWMGWSGPVTEIREAGNSSGNAQVYDPFGVRSICYRLPMVTVSSKSI